MPTLFTSMSVAPPPERIKKGQKKKVLDTAEYLEATRILMSGSVAAGQWIVVPNDEETKKRFGSKDPGRALHLAIAGFIKMHRLGEVELGKYQPSKYPEGYSVIAILPVVDDLRTAVPHEVPAQSTPPSLRGKRKSAPAMAGKGSSGSAR